MNVIINAQRYVNLKYKLQKCNSNNKYLIINLTELILNLKIRM